jgi:hypothetical protein
VRWGGSASTARVDFEIRLLSHAQIMTVQWIPRKESFTISRLGPLAAGNGRCSACLHPDSDLYFTFAGPGSRRSSRLGSTP